MWPWLQRHLFTLIFGVIGLIFLAVGGLLGWFSLEAKRQAEVYAARPLLTAAEIAAAPPGQEVMAEGRIGERNPVVFEELVTYQARQYQGQKCEHDNDNRTRCEDIWQELERVTPPLWLDVADGRLRVSNTDYTLASPPLTRLTPAGNLVAGQTIQYRGFPIGSPVFVDGVIDPAEGGSVRAEFIFGGSRQEYVASQQDQSQTLVIIGLIFGGLGALFAAIGGGVALLGGKGVNSGESVQSGRGNGFRVRGNRNYSD
jgi:hypothetical protein